MDTQNSKLFSSESILTKTYDPTTFKIKTLLVLKYGLN